MSTFPDKFAPVPNEGLGLTLILDMITLGYAAVAAPVWKTVGADSLVVNATLTP